ncbi:hypothetical protein OC846_000429 [Tilletia horrida]|uniref:PIG-P domain-containing protein n=1 Tax=Tilletia horrida TaxID=155126 RepID=A0AAN6GV44_9BASI|nr:hypothetical protein OC845_001072 [Tilletia horrida]KAK0557441.1 hypothetical protein OC846_000429 [Tilletia horrida]KAK0569545.1 hypothetical protein OC861_000814 [Tilletia horrida]
MSSSQLGDRAALRPPPIRSSSSSEYYGFALYTLSTVLWLAWIVWALVPHHVLEQWGVLWMPSREWAYLLPAWSMAAMLFAYAAYLSLNIMNTAGPGERKSFVDDHSDQGSTRDIPFGVVSRSIYLLPELSERTPLETQRQPE